MKSKMFIAKTGVEIHINEIELHANLTDYHGHALQLSAKPLKLKKLW